MYITTIAKIRTFKDNENLIKEIEKKGFNKATILNITLLDSE